MNPGSLRFMLVTDPDLLRGRDLVDVVLSAVAGGVTIVQLRDKRASDADLEARARSLMPALHRLGVPLIVNDRVALAARIGAAGVHVGQSDMSPREARAILGPAAIVGLSIERLEQGQDVDPAQVSYLGVSPVFATSTKRDVAPALGLDGVRALRGIGLPLVGIGGIHAGNAREVTDAGAAGVAVISAVLAASNPEIAARAIHWALTRPAG